MKYYSTQRPVMPGSYPKEGIVSLHNFDDKTMVPEIGIAAWGYIEYNRVLTVKEMESYELIPEGMKTWYGVVATVHNDGRVTCAIADTVQSIWKPESEFKSLRARDIYIDWFDSKESAEEFIKETRIE